MQLEKCFLIILIEKGHQNSRLIKEKFKLQ